MSALEIVFWSSSTLILYVYLGYPIGIYLISKICRRKLITGGDLPDCEIIIVGYNEAHNLQKKIQSILDSAAIGSVCKIHVGSDGSTDATDQVLASLNDERIIHHAFTERRGKPAVLNELAPAVDAEVIILTDARQELAPDAITKLLSRFSDDNIGVVSGELVFRDDTQTTTAAKGMNTYWVYEKFIRNAEGRVASVAGATGALYAIRAELFKPIHPNSLLDDMAIPFQAIFQGKRCVFEAGAKAFDEPSTSAEKESVRKRRTLAGNLQLIAHYPRLLLPIANPIWFQFMSHKALRLVAPFALIAALYSNVQLNALCCYEILLYLQIIFYALALLGCLASKTNVKTGLLGAPFMFVALNVAMLLAWWDALNGRFSAAWDRSDKK